MDANELHDRLSDITKGKSRFDADGNEAARSRQGSRGSLIEEVLQVVYAYPRIRSCTTISRIFAAIRPSLRKLQQLWQAVTLV